MDAFADAQWIWDNDLQQQNVYLDFSDTFTGEKNRTYTLYISTHTQYAVYLNDQYIPGSQCADYETYQIYDQIDLTKWVTEGTNRLKITCYYQGFDCSATKAAKPGLIYVIRQNHCTQFIRYASLQKSVLSAGAGALYLRTTGIFFCL